MWSCVCDVTAQLLECPACVQSEETQTEANWNLLSLAVTLCPAVPSDRQKSAVFIWEKPQYPHFITGDNFFCVKKYAVWLSEDTRQFFFPVLFMPFICIYRKIKRWTALYRSFTTFKDMSSADVTGGYLGLGLKYMPINPTLQGCGVWKTWVFTTYKGSKKDWGGNWSHCFGGLTKCRDVLAVVAIRFFLSCSTKFPDWKKFSIILMMSLEPR